MLNILNFDMTSDVSDIDLGIHLRHVKELVCHELRRNFRLFVIYF